MKETSYKVIQKAAVRPLIIYPSRRIQKALPLRALHRKNILTKLTPEKAVKFFTLVIVLFLQVLGKLTQEIFRFQAEFVIRTLLLLLKAWWRSAQRFFSSASSTPRQQTNVIVIYGANLNTLPGCHYFNLQWFICGDLNPQKMQVFSVMCNWGYC